VEKHELMSKTVVQLRALAAEKKAKVADDAFKADIVAAILEKEEEDRRVKDSPEFPDSTPKSDDSAEGGSISDEEIFENPGDEPNPNEGGSSGAPTENQPSFDSGLSTQDISMAPPTPPDAPLLPAAIHSDPVPEGEFVEKFLFRPKSGQPFAPLGVPVEGVVAEEGSAYEHHVGTFLEKLPLDGGTAE
jgi:hypothetical protein